MWTWIIAFMILHESTNFESWMHVKTRNQGSREWIFAYSPGTTTLHMKSTSQFVISSNEICNTVKNGKFARQMSLRLLMGENNSWWEFNIVGKSAILKKATSTSITICMHNKEQENKQKSNCSKFEWITAQNWRYNLNQKRVWYDVMVLFLTSDAWQVILDDCECHYNFYGFALNMPKGGGGLYPTICQLTGISFKCVIICKIPYYTACLSHIVNWTYSNTTDA